MQTIEIDTEKLHELDELNTTCSHNESKIYVYDKNTLLKRLYPKLAGRRRKTIQFLGDYSNQHCVLPREAYVDENGVFRGYTMDYLKKYRVIGKLTINPKIGFDRRLSLCKSVCAAVRSLEEDHIAYYDVHSDNVMVNKDDEIKLIDMDSVTIKRSNNDLDYGTDLRYAHRHTAELCMASLYGIDDCDLRTYIPIVYDALRLKANQSERELLMQLYKKTGNVFYAEEYLDSVREEFIEDTKKFWQMAMK